MKLERKKANGIFAFPFLPTTPAALHFDEDFVITHQSGTHNSPSALDPFGGAITGIVGVNRDALGFGLGAKPVINVLRVLSRRAG